MIDHVPAIDPGRIEQLIRAEQATFVEQNLPEGRADLLRIRSPNDPVIRRRWLYQIQRGVFEPGSDPWTISVQHTEDDVRRYVSNLQTFAHAVRE